MEFCHQSLVTFFRNILRKQAKDLLERAKGAVEIAIEQDEQTAIDWLESVSETAALHSSFWLPS